MAGRVVDHKGSMGAALGIAGGGVAICAAHRASPGTTRTGVGRDVALDRLAASTLCLDPVRGNCCGGRVLSATLSNETDGEGADLGVDPDADCAGDRDSVLGSAIVGAAAGSRLRLQGKTGAGP